MRGFLARYADYRKHTKLSLITKMLRWLSEPKLRKESM
jgi:hypothetical protein